MDTLQLMAAIIRSSQFTIIGRIGRDPEPKYFDSGKCKLQLSIAVNRSNAKREENVPPDWFKAEFWDDDAQAAADELQKGDLVKVTGRIYSETWTTREGEDRTDLMIKVENWAPLVAENTAPPSAPAAQLAAAQTPAIAPPVLF
jgi:single-strand DNA-binding protein